MSDFVRWHAAYHAGGVEGVRGVFADGPLPLEECDGKTRWYHEQDAHDRRTCRAVYEVERAESARAEAEVFDPRGAWHLRHCPLVNCSSAGDMLACGSGREPWAPPNNGCPNCFMGPNGEFVGRTCAEVWASGYGREVRDAIKGAMGAVAAEPDYTPKRPGDLTMADLDARRKAVVAEIERLGALLNPTPIAPESVTDVPSGLVEYVADPRLTPGSAEYDPCAEAVRDDGEQFRCGRCGLGIRFSEPPSAVATDFVVGYGVSTEYEDGVRMDVDPHNGERCEAGLHWRCLSAGEAEREYHAEESASARFKAELEFQRTREDPEKRGRIVRVGDRPRVTMEEPARWFRSGASWREEP